MAVIHAIIAISHDIIERTHRQFIEERWPKGGESKQHDKKIQNELDPDQEIQLILVARVAVSMLGRHMDR